MGKNNTPSARVADLENFVPTLEAVNRPPTGIRQYVHDLQTRCDPSGDVQELTLARDTCRALELRVEELEAENARLLSIMPPTAGAADPRFVGQGDWAVFAEKVVAERDQLRIDVRQAIADYMGSEGCSCCQNVEAHKEHTKQLAELLDVPMYGDGSGYDFHRFRSPGEGKL